MQVMKWLGKFRESVERHTKRSIQNKVLDGIAVVPLGSTKAARRDQTAWIGAAMNRLDALVDEETRNRILVDTCPHKYPKKRIREMKSRLQGLGSIDDLLKAMRSDTSWGGGSFYDYPTRDGNVIHVTKVPYNPKTHKAALTDEEKRRTYCHCSIVKSNMEMMSPTFCCCSGGWVKQLWEGVLGIALEVKMTESILKGDKQCTHSFEIPISLL
ncbi:MAG: hypothetical protein ACFFEU_02705 [Candidatus Thorarchaeota archaeon]